jgi:hypothetical protein
MAYAEGWLFGDRLARFRQITGTTRPNITTRWNLPTGALDSWARGISGLTT